MSEFEVPPYIKVRVAAEEWVIPNTELLHFAF